MQSKKSSINEVLLNTGSGFIVSLVVTKALYPVLNILSPVTITLIYTVVSIIRSYIWRRLFNKRILKQCK
jgi:antibiotic biosynthesis monooxygenase (ABM) superfamily enzyme